MRNVEDLYPLSPLQESLLYHALSEQGSSAGFQQAHATLNGRLDLVAFERSWHHVVEMHPILRSIFIADEVERPLQAVRSRVELPIVRQDWRGLTAAEKRSRLERFLAADRQRGFDLMRAPLMRLALFQAGEESYELVWSYHHLLLDAWGHTLLLRQVFESYAAFCRGEVPRIEASRHYRDYISWLQSQDLSQAEEFWRRALMGHRGPTRLQIGWPPAADAEELAGVRGTLVEEVGGAESARLGAFARQHRLTLNTLIHGAWALLLHRYSGDKNVLFGMLASGRTADLSGIDSMVGMFTNNLPVPITVESGEPVLGWLTWLQAHLAEVRQYEYCSLAQIQQWGGMPSSQRAFESLVLFQNFPVDDIAAKLSGQGLEIRFHDGFMEIHIPLDLVVWRSGPRLFFRLDYDAGRFERVAIARIVGHLRSLLAGMAASPETEVGRLPLLSDAERQEIVEWARTGSQRGLELRVLGRDAQPLPQGVAGEVCFAGDLAYQDDVPPASLAASFMPDLLSEVPGGRLYRTGARGRWSADGRLEELGTLDDSFEIGGREARPGEIEAALRRAPAVARAAVCVRQGEEDIRGLTAFVSAAPGGTLQRGDILRFLRRALPESPVPDLVVLDELPLRGDGHIDRVELENRVAASRHDLAMPGSPRTPMERKLCEIWSQLLAVARVGVDENLLELGAQSLTVMQFTLRVRQELGVELPLRTLFEDPTVAGIASRIERAGPETGGGIDTPLIRRVPRDRGLPLSFAQQRLWFIQQLEPESPAYNIPEAVHALGQIDVQILRRILNEIVRRHESLRTTFAFVDEHPVQLIAQVGELTLPEIDLRALPEAVREVESARLRDEEARAPFDLTRGPLLRVSLVTLGPQEHLILFTMHHIVSDAWSMGVLVSEIKALYTALTSGAPSPLDELPVQYPDFAVWQREWLQGAALDEQMRYWERILGGRLPILRLPFSRPRPKRPTHRARVIRFWIATDVSEALQQLALRQGVTLFMVLVAAFEVLLYRHSGQEDLIVATEVANRAHVQSEPLIGFFVNMLVLRTDLSGNPSFLAALGRVRDTCIGAFSHQDVPLEKLVEHIQPERSDGEIHLLRHVFVLENAPGETLAIPGLTLRSLSADHQTSKFDLLMIMEAFPSGLAGSWTYSVDLFDAEDVSKLAADFTALLGDIARRPATRLRDFEIPSQSERDRLIMENKAERATKRPSLSSFKPQAVKLSSATLVRREYFFDEKFPLVYAASAGNLDLADWAKNRMPELQQELLQNGAILFRGFDVRSASHFERFCEVLCPELYREYGDLPRPSVENAVYESTPYPPDKPILMHNESSHLHSWPLKQWFFCVQPARERGETPIVDSRRLYQRLDPAVRDKFAHLGLLYVRNLSRDLDLGWREFFRTEDRSEVEQRCREAGFDFEWTEDDGLRISTLAPAVARHPKTGEMVFFNQIQAHHISCLDPEVRESLLSLYSQDRLPRNVYYGDGCPIEDSLVADLRALYDEMAVSFPWQEGDVLMVDNMLTAHGRNPFEGPRKILVAMGEVVTKADIA